VPFQTVSHLFAVTVVNGTLGRLRHRRTGIRALTARPTRMATLDALAIRDDVIRGVSLRVFLSAPRSAALGRRMQGPQAPQALPTVGDTEAITMPWACAEICLFIAAFTKIGQNAGRNIAHADPQAQNSKVSKAQCRS